MRRIRTNADVGLRELERAYAEEGTVEAWEALVRQQARLGVPKSYPPLPPWSPYRMTTQEIAGHLERARRTRARVEATYAPGREFYRGVLREFPGGSNRKEPGNVYARAGFPTWITTRFFVGRSTGTAPVLLKLHNRSSRGGDIIKPEDFVYVRVLDEDSSGRWKNNPDERTRVLERRWKESDDARDAEAFFHSLVRSGEWSPTEHPSLFWALLGEPRMVQAMLDSARSCPDAPAWEKNPNSYVFLSAFRLGYMGRVEARREDDLGVRRAARFHVAARRYGSSHPWGRYTVSHEITSEGAVPLPGSDPPALLVITGGVQAKKHAGKILKSRDAGRILYPEEYASTRVMEAIPSKTMGWLWSKEKGAYRGEKTRVRWKNNPDERTRRSQRKAAAGDVHEEAAFLRDRLRSRTIGLDNLRLAALIGHVPAQLAIDYVPPDPPYIQPDQVMIQVAQDNEWGHRAAALWAYACVKGTEWIWDEVNGNRPQFPTISMAPNNAMGLIQNFLDAGTPCRLQVYGFRERLEDVAHELNEISFNTQDHGCACEAPDVATCGICERSWCDRCDPTPSAMCHFCHGRGSSDAEIGGAEPDRYLMAEGAQNWIGALTNALSLWSEGENMHSHSRASIWGNRHTLGDLWVSAPGSLGTHTASVPLYARMAREAYRQAVWAVDLYRGGTGSQPSPVLDKAQLDVDRWARAIMLPELLA